MTRPPVSATARRGITLAEILVSLMILAIGLISLATLFPLGLLRIREANRNSRSTLLGKSGYGDMGVRNLIDKRTFPMTWYNTAYFPLPFDPLSQDPNWQDAQTPLLSGVSATLGPGLPVCYDPLWRAYTKPNPGLGFTAGFGTYPNSQNEARFGSGVGWLRTDPNDGNPASAYGLQRITNFLPVGFAAATAYWPFYYPAAATIFASNDDIVWQTHGNKTLALPPDVTGVGSPIVPDLSGGSLLSDWRYSWFFTGFQADVNDPSPDVYVGNIVVCENRQFGYDMIPSPIGAGPIAAATGEVVVEAIFGAGNFSQSATGYAIGGDNVVLLRWPATIPDPQIRAGGWIADVTYERYTAVALARFPNFSANPTVSTYPAQRCFWYRVVKKTAVATDPVVPGYRFMTVIIDSPVQAKTGLGANGFPVINAALIMPSVINVFPKIIYVR